MCFVRPTPSMFRASRGIRASPSRSSPPARRLPGRPPPDRQFSRPPRPLGVRLSRPPKPLLPWLLVVVRLCPFDDVSFCQIESYGSSSLTVKGTCTRTATTTGLFTCGYTRRARRSCSFSVALIGRTPGLDCGISPAPVISLLETPHSSLPGTFGSYHIVKQKVKNGTTLLGTQLVAGPVSPTMTPVGTAQSAASELLSSILDSITRILENHVVVGELLDSKSSQKSDIINTSSMNGEQAGIQTLNCLKQLEALV